MSRLLFMVLLTLVLCGCAATPGAGPGASPPSAARDTAALAAERQWLRSWFGDTPVRIAQSSDTAISIEIPREFCFDPGHSHVKPALAAVLDKVAESLRRVPQLRLELIAAPADSAASTPLALQRATQMRVHLVDRGVPAGQLGGPQAAAAESVQLRMALASL
jgi:outer membrane protein OmpA-like peptidoglycan-associated protein